MKSHEHDDCVVRIWIEIHPLSGCKRESQVKKVVKRPRGRPVEVGEKAEKWLKNYLVSGPKYAGDKSKPKPGTVFGDSLAAGFKSNVIWRAAKKLGVHKHQELFTRRWLWTLPWQENVEYAIRENCEPQGIM